MATIGRLAAVAQIGPLGLSGVLAWLAWLALHLVWLIGFRNRLIVLINWAWSYIRYDQAIRIITSLPARQERAAEQRAPTSAASTAGDAARTGAGDA
jgi:NADH dehydrogenase